jgi:2-desacetyl-2-hydroxyethyl bacteriochlorophyllide A dehydrogenase
MKAAILYGPHDLRLVGMPEPAVDDRGVLIRVKAMGICGSDVHAYHGKLATVVYPRLIGHEAVGEAVAVGKNVQKIKPGDHVVMDPVVSCGRCPACRSGRGNVCKEVKCMGVAAEGGCAEYIVLPESNVHVIPADLPWPEAALIEPYTIGAQVTSRGEVAAGETLLVMGAGTIGLVILQAAKRRRARVIVTDLSEGRLELARRLDADVTVNPRRQDLAVAVSQFTDGYGVNVAVDAVGLPELFAQAVEYTAPAGRVVILGFNPAPSQVPELPITRKELDIRGSRMHCGKFPEVIGWFAAREVKTTPLISHQFPLDHIHDAFKILEQDPDKTCKVMVTF